MIEGLGPAPVPMNPVPQTKSGQQAGKAKGPQAADASFAETLTSTSGSIPLQKGAAPVEGIDSDPLAEPNQTPLELVQSEGLVARVAGTKGKSAQVVSAPLTEQQAMATFLNRMQVQLGIEPEQVLRAFAKLDVDNLMATPEDSAEAFLKNLDLSPAEQSQALNLYNDLLTWRQTADLSQSLKRQGQEAEMTVMTKDQMVKRDRLQNIESLSDRFFMMGDFSRGKTLANNNMNVAMKAYMPPAIKGPIPTTAENQALDVSPKFDEVIAQSAGEAQGKIDLQALGLEMVTPETVEIDSTVTPKALAGPEGAQTLEMAIGGQFELGQEQESTDQSTTDQQAEGEDLSSLQGLRLDRNDRADLPKSFVIQSPVPTETEMQENLREVIRGAQVMVKNGGGEMKVNLHPEGLGHLNLKVMVQNGEVKVEMITTSDETKKLLEKGLSELKSGLSAHKLNVEHVKIETAQRTAEQMMQNQQEAAERGFQQRFLQDFRDQNGFRRFQAMGIEPARRMTSQTTDPADNEIGAAERRRRVERRLDLVA